VRRPYIDWLRGLAVLIMMEWHALDAWTTPEARATEGFRIAALLGGWAAPLFLFLAGVAIPFAGAATMKKTGADRRAAAFALQIRGWQVFVLAHLFRFQSFLFDLSATWSSLFKPDILNILGLGMVATAFCWGRATNARRAMLLLVVPAAILVLLAPWSRTWDWPAVLHPRLEAYIRPVGNLGVFTLFPWMAFVVIGAYAGQVISAARPAGAEPRFHLKLGAAGLGIAGAGWIGSQLPAPIAASDFWTTSVSFFLIRLGIMTFALAGAWAWMQRPRHTRWSPLLVFGRTSLFVYWVHVALAYGAFTLPLHHALSLGSAVVAFGLLTLLMLALAIWWSARAPIPPHPLSTRRLRQARGT
jgi:uncharacterized membrane protein